LDSKLSRRNCSVADALALVGDRYSLLVVREIGYGNVRFGELVRRTGAPRDVLTARLRGLEDAGVIERRRYSERPPRHEYHLTASGLELGPIVLALKEWGDRHLNPGAEPVVFEHHCGAEFHPLTVCAGCGEPIRKGELRVSGGVSAVPGETW
jgi:DNA-binding HxlR family transcriptional regulator